MNLNDLFHKINESAAELDFVTARTYIEENIEILENNRQHLKNNARDLFDFIKSQLNGGINPLGRKELSIINTVNTYATKFDVRGMKFLIKENASLFIRTDIIPYLNADAKILLSGMGAINQT